MEAIKHDSGKVRFSLLPVEPLTDIAKVFTFGAQKYSDYNFMNGEGLKSSRVYDSLQRHLNSWFGGVDDDEETGLSHLAHAGCCIMMLMLLHKFRPNSDNRQKF
jgi:hypothetical protein